MPVTSSARSPSRFGISSVAMMVTPVRLPPGRARVETRPDSTGSVPMMKTLEIARVVLFAANAGNQLGPQPEPLWHQLGRHDGDAREVAARSGESGDKTRLDRVGANDEDARDRPGGTLRRQCR